MNKYIKKKKITFLSFLFIPCFFFLNAYMRRRKNNSSRTIKPTTSYERHYHLIAVRSQNHLNYHAIDVLVLTALYGIIQCFTLPYYNKHLNLLFLCKVTWRLPVILLCYYISFLAWIEYSYTDHLNAFFFAGSIHLQHETKFLLPVSCLLDRVANIGIFARHWKRACQFNWW